jgi:acetyltransferase-like isoleucine patch superfamily enzyme
VTLGFRVRTGHNVVVREKVLVGDDTLLGTNLIVDGDSRIGKHVSIQSGVYICANCTVEDYVFLGPHCVFTNDKYAMQKQALLVGPVVRREASVGANALLMPAVEIGEASVVGAQALVTRNVPPRTIVSGVPARRMKDVPHDWKSLLREKCLMNGCHK